MAFVFSAVAEAVGGGILGAMADGAVAGGLVSAVTGGNVVQGALMGGITGGIGSGIAGAIGGAVGGAAGDVSGASAALAEGAANGMTAADLTQVAAQYGVSSDAAAAMAEGAANGLSSADLAQVANAYSTGAPLSDTAAKAIGGVAKNSLGQWVNSAGNVLGAATQYNAAGTAANQQVSALQAAQQAQLGVYNQQRSDQAPFMTAGTTAVNALTAGIAPGGQFNKPFTMADAQNMPAYQFALQQGQQALGNQAAMGGQQLSANNLAGQTKLAEGLAAQYENQAFMQNLDQNQLALGATQNLAGMGQNATNAVGNAAQNYSTNVGNNLTNIGAAQAQGTNQQANAISGGIGGVTKALTQAANTPNTTNPIPNISPSQTQTQTPMAAVAPVADVTSPQYSLATGTPPPLNYGTAPTSSDPYSLISSVFGVGAPQTVNP